jgi:hypothetical protein
MSFAAIQRAEQDFSAADPASNAKNSPPTLTCFLAGNQPRQTIV